MACKHALPITKHCPYHRVKYREITTLPMMYLGQNGMSRHFGSEKNVSRKFSSDDIKMHSSENFFEVQSMTGTEC